MEAFSNPSRQDCQAEWPGHASNGDAVNRQISAPCQLHPNANVLCLYSSRCQCPLVRTTRYYTDSPPSHARRPHPCLSSSLLRPGLRFLLLPGARRCTLLPVLQATGPLRPGPRPIYKAWHPKGPREPPSLIPRSQNGAQSRRSILKSL